MRITHHLALPAIFAASIALGGHAFAQTPVVDYDLGGAIPTESASSDVGSGGPVVDYDLGGVISVSSPAPAPAIGTATTTPPVAIPRNGPTIRPGRSHPHVALLRQRLGVAKPSGRSANYYDDALAEAVKSFQRKKGLDVDGVVGRLTRAAF
ncbi:MAG: peptidoglycan-binding protein [Pseudomonadota bacterium]